MAKITLFIPCFVDQIMPRAGQAMVRVLERLGCELEFPEEQTCCGQPAFNSGFWDEARPLAARWARIFARAETVVAPSGSCATMVRHFYPHLAGSDAGLRRELDAAGARVYEFSEFLVRQLHIEDVGAYFPHRVAMHDACHALRELGLKDEPRRLLRQVRGLELTEAEDCERCCGFGGAFAVKYGMISAAMGERKIAALSQAGVDYVTSTDPSCLLHLGGMLGRQPGRVRPIYLAEILAQTQDGGAAA